MTDAQNVDGVASPVDTPSTTTEGGQSAHPRSATSSEGMSLWNVGYSASQIAFTALSRMIK